MVQDCLAQLAVLGSPKDRVIEKSIRRQRPKGDSLAPTFWSFFYLHDSNGAQIGSDARKKAAG